MRGCDLCIDVRVIGCAGASATSLFVGSVAVQGMAWVGARGPRKVVDIATKVEETSSTTGKRSHVIKRNFPNSARTVRF